MKTAASLGVIGGADGPTAIFVTGGNAGTGISILVIAVLLVMGIVLLKKTKR